MARTKHAKYTGAIASARVELEKTQKVPKATCSLDRGICSNQFGAGFMTGCSSTEPCESKRPNKLGKRAMKNKGLHQYRFKDNPLEKAFAEAWERENTTKGGAMEGRGYLDYLLAEDCNCPRGEVTDRDRVVAATVVQWLGSPIGQCFIKECQGEVL